MPHNAVTFKWFDDNVDLFRPSSSLLYVGWRNGSKMWWLDSFGPAIGATRIALLEVFKPNFDAYCRGEKFHGNIADFGDMFDEGEWDTVFFDHGPEHSPSIAWLTGVTNTLKKRVRQIIYACPWGECPQESSYGNDYEKHALTVYPVMLEEFGMKTQTFNAPDTGASGEIAAWWTRETVRDGA